MTAPPIETSVVLCTRNRATDLDAHLHTVDAAVRGAARPAELIVVDNGSTDGTAELIRRGFPDIRLIREDTPGLATARNTGVRAARANAVLFTDDDVDVPSDWVDRMSAPLRAGSADVVVGGIRVADDLRRPWITPWMLQNLADYPRQQTVDPDVVGANFGARRSLLRVIPFDERLGVAPYQRAEDAFFGVQARELGARIIGVAGTPIAHHFDPARLESAALYKMLRAAGRCSAWVWHHWAHGNAPHLQLKSIVARARRLPGVPWLRRHPTDHDLRLVSQIAFFDELRRIADVPPHYPSPAARKRDGWRDYQAVSGD